MPTPLALETPTAADLELIELAREVIDANTDAGPDEDGAHTMGAAVRAADGRMTLEGGTQEFDAARFS